MTPRHILARWERFHKAAPLHHANCFFALLYIAEGAQTYHDLRKHLRLSIHSARSIIVHLLRLGLIHQTNTDEQNANRNATPRYAVKSEFYNAFQLKPTAT